MDPAQFRFSSIDALRQPQVDAQRLKAHGQIEVDGKAYTIRSAADGRLDVTRTHASSSAEHFFKAANNLLSRPSRSAQIAQVLNEKMQSAASACGPSLERARGGRFEPLRLGLEVPPADGKATFDSLHAWAKRAKKLHPRDKEAIYTLYASDKPATPPLNAGQQQALLEALRDTDKIGGVRVWPQFMDKVTNKEDLNLDLFIRYSDKAKDEFYKLVPEQRPTSSRGSDRSRLSINIEPRYSVQLVHAIAELVRHEPGISAAKITGPAEMGQRAESAVLYLDDDYTSAERLGHALRDRLPAGALLAHRPAGMHPVATGIYYAETAPGDSTSHGLSRAAIVQSACEDASYRPLADKLRKAIALHGYNPENPAFVAGNGAGQASTSRTP